MKTKIKILAQTIGKYLLLLVIWIFSIVVAQSLSPFIDKQDKPISTLLYEFLPFLGLFIGHLVVIKFFEKSNLSYVRIYKKSILSNTVKGFVIGLIWILISALVIVLINKGEIKTSLSMPFSLLLSYFIILFINSAMQELLVHGYLFSLLQKKYSNWAALITTSLLFLLLHPGAINSGIIASINVFAAGLIFGLITLKYDSLLNATIAHTVWNYFGAVWFGLIPLTAYPSMKLITVEGTQLLVGDKNGMETSIIVTVTAVVFVCFLVNKKMLYVENEQ